MKTVLLIDDEFYFRQAMKKYFREFAGEFTVCGEANNGREGLEKILTLKPDIALVDITMPQMDGIEVIGEALRQGSSAKMVVLTGYSEFEYAQKALRLGVQDYLLKPVQVADLRKCLDKVSRQIDKEAEERLHSTELLRERDRMIPMRKEHFLQEVLKKDGDWTEVRRLAKEIPFDLEKDYYCAVLCDIEIDAAGPWAENDLQLCQYSAANILTELFAAQMECISGINENKTLYFLLGADGDDEACLSLLRSALDRFLSTVREHLEFSVLVCVGSLCQDPENLERSYQEAVFMEKYQRLQQGRGVHFYSDSAFLGRVAYIFPNEQHRRLHTLMRQNDVEGVTAMISGIFQKMKELSLRPDVVYMQTSDIISCAFEFATQNQVFSEKFRVDANYLSLPDSFESMDALYRHTLSYLLRIMERVSQSGQFPAHNPLSDQISDYIEENYFAPGLGLDEISAHFFISRQHLCYLFKKEYGITVGDFLLQVRMEHAKKLLDDNCENVSLVSLKCGYEDAGYFGKCFKQYYGVSPKAYLASREEIRPSP